MLHTAKRTNFIRDQSGIDPDHAILQLLGHAPDAAEVARVADDAGAVATAMAQVLAAPDQAAERAEAAYQRLRADFTLDAMFYRYLSLYGELLHRPIAQAPQAAATTTA